MIKTFNEIVEKAISCPNVKIAVAKAENEEVLEAVEEARKMGIADSILVGDKSKILRCLKSLDIDESNYEIVHVEGEMEAGLEAVRIVSTGKADILMKGLIETATLLKAVLNKEVGLRKSKVISHVGIFELEKYHKLLVVTDPAINIKPTLEQKAEIIKNAVTVTKALGIDESKVAVLCAKEKVNEKMEATLDAKALTEMSFDGAIVDGPLAFDNAVSKESVRIKGIDSPVAGDADIVLVPRIEAGNILYKALTIFTDSRLAGVIVGAAKPVIVTSRADTMQAKLDSISMGIIMSQLEV